MKTDEEVPKRPRGRHVRAVSLADCLEKRDARVGGWIAKCEAEKKDQKNFEKWVKDTEKARTSRPPTWPSSTTPSSTSRRGRRKRGDSVRDWVRCGCGGRRGKRVKVEENTNTLMQTFTYADGTAFSFPFSKAKPMSVAARFALEEKRKAEAEKKRLAQMPPRLQEVEKQRQENLSHTNEVVVDFGPQGAQ